MNQVRFNIGGPRAGSAARIAEDSSEVPSRSMRPQAGLAARSAEEAKRVAPVAVQRSASIGLRAGGGRVVTAEELHNASVRSSAAPHPSTSHATHQAVVERIPANADTPVPLLMDRTAFVSSTQVSEQVVEENASSRPLQMAAVRIKSLVQSLFSLGASSSKS